MTLDDFIVESNRIENIHRPPTAPEVQAHVRLLDRPVLDVSDLELFVHVVTDGRAQLRRRLGMNVRITSVPPYFPPPGNPDMDADLQSLLDAARDATLDPWRLHLAYEALHPFNDGNGRSGRALWAWQMLRAGQDPFEFGFLRAFYYQTLSANR